MYKYYFPRYFTTRYITSSKLIYSKWSNTNNITKSSRGNLTYTITIPNYGNVTAANVVFTDTIPNGTSLVANPVTVNGTTIPGANPQSGINIGTISAGASFVVQFSVQVNC